MMKGKLKDELLSADQRGDGGTPFIRKFMQMGVMSILVSTSAQEYNNPFYIGLIW